MREKGKDIIQMERLFSVQRKLDERIEREHQLENKDLFSDKVLAFMTEVGELANETRCFKFWSRKPPSEREIILEEYVDGIHFLLSLGLECGFEEIPPFPNEEREETPLQLHFLHVFQCASQFHESPNRETYHHLFAEYLKLGEGIGFTKDEVERAYYEKNEINHQRQTEGY